jgi:hypothetical protein
MIQSETIGELAKALAAAQGEFEPVPKTSENPFYKSKYANLADIVKIGSKVLSKHGIAVMQFPEASSVEAHDLLTTLVMHSSGEWVQGTMRIRAKDDTAQGQGSAITYGRRYAYGGATGLVTDEDDDGNAASKPAHPAGKAKPVDKQTGEIVRPSPLRAVPPGGDHLGRPEFEQLSAAQGKKELLSYFEKWYDPLQAKAKAIEAWGERGSNSISRADFDGILTLYAANEEPPREDEG